MTEEKKLFGWREWRMVALGIVGVLLGFVMVHLYNDHQNLHQLFDLVRQSQTQHQASPEPKQ